MLFILLLSGLCSGLQHQYHLVMELKTWSEAQSYCREQYTDLATIDNMEDMNRLLDAAGSGDVGPVWIGLYDKPDSWRWSLSDEYLYGAGEHFKNWGNFEPNNKGGRQFCGRIVQGYWNDGPCDSEYPFVCYDNTTKIKDMQTSTSGRYIYVQEEKTWKDAQQYCRQHFTDLVSVRNKAENDEIKEMVSEKKKTWIGLFRDSWSWWSGGSNSSFRYWMDGQPDNDIIKETCVASIIDHFNHGKWSDKQCTEKYNIICYSSPKKKHLFKIKLMSVDSTFDQNNPAVMEAILKQMERKLKEKGMSEDVQLAWRRGPDGKVFHKEEK